MTEMLHRIKKHIEQILFRIFSFFPINENLILFESEGDLSDNSFALYDYMKKNGYFEKYQAIWLVKKNDPLINYNKYQTVPKWTHWIDIHRLYILSTSKYSIYDHSNVLADYKIRKEQIIINLFHGCTFKATKGVAGVTDTEKFMPITGDFWKSIMAGFVCCSLDKVISLGYPRNDYLTMKPSDQMKQWIDKLKWRNFNKILIWMPTFRRSATSNLSENYYSGETGLPILEYNKDMIDLNSLLCDLNILLVIKIHHLQLDYETFKKDYSNVQLIKDGMLISSDVQLYQMVSMTDGLITDYSSISNDYMLLDRPMIFTLDDYEEYRASRGFSVDDPAQYFPGHHVFNKEELFKAIEDIAKGLDPYKEQRHDLLPIMHKYQDGNSCKRIVDYIGLSNQ